MKAKICILAPYVGIVNRGAETFVIELAKKLAYCYKLEIYTLGVCVDIEEHIVKIEKFRKPFWFNIHKKLFQSNRYYKKIIERTFVMIPDVLEQKYFSKYVYDKYLKFRDDISIMYPNNGHHGAKIAWKLRKDKNVPFIYTGHGGAGYSEQKILDLKPDFYVALTEFQKEWALRTHRNVVKIPNGVDTSIFIDRKRVKPESTVICVGALVSAKRQQLLIDAVSLLEETKLILIGDGDLKPVLEAYGNGKLKDRFKVLSIPYEEMPSCYSIGDVFSLPTKDEPFGIVYIEAMACNLPIVAPNDSTRVEIIGDAGILCDVENAVEYANAIKEAIEKNWEEIPRNRATSIFEWEIIAMKYHELIKDLID